MKEVVESVYKVILRIVEMKMGNDFTMNTQLDEYMKDCNYEGYLGAFPRTLGLEIVDDLKIGECLIINTKDAPGEHWCALYMFPSGNTIFYDSFGRTFEELFRQDDGIGNTEDDREQELIEQNCGQRCIAWLLLARTVGEAGAVWV